MLSSTACLLLSAASVAWAQFVPAPTDLLTATGYTGLTVRYKEVPTGICELDPNVKSYSGYVDVEKDQHIFFWFFAARNVDPSEAPLTVWINGGPGTSSMIGLFQELGPCTVDINGQVVNNPYSWTNVSNMIFIDQPTQTGFSYSDPIVNGYTNNDTLDVVVLPDAICPQHVKDNYGDDTCGTFSHPDMTKTANSTERAAPNFWKTLQGFMGVFPQYAKHEVHLAAQSYGGHWLPVYADYILAQNAKDIPGAYKIPLSSVQIGNGWFDGLVQYQSYYNFTVSPGNTYDYFPYDAGTEQELYNNLYGPGNCVDQIKDCQARGIDNICAASLYLCAGQVHNILLEYSDRDRLDIRQVDPSPFPPDFYAAYLNTPEVQAAIGAYQNFSSSNMIVNRVFGWTGDDSRETTSVMKSLVQRGVPVMLYAGDADYVCDWIGLEVVAAAVEAAGFDRAGYVDLSTSDAVVHGQVKQAGSFSFVRVYDAGHMAPFFQPLATLEMFERAIAGRDIATGTQLVDPGYVTVGPPQSLYRQGNATVETQALPRNATYNHQTNRANKPAGQLAARGLGRRAPKAGKGASDKGGRDGPGNGDEGQEGEGQ